MFKKPEFSIHNVKPQRKNQDSAGGMGNISSRDLFIHISKIMQTRIIRQLPKVFDKLTYFMQNKANFQKGRMSVNYYLQKEYDNEPRLCRQGKQSQTKPIFLHPKSGKVCIRLGDRSTRYSDWNLARTIIFPSLSAYERSWHAFAPLHVGTWRQKIRPRSRFLFRCVTSKCCPTS